MGDTGTISDKGKEKVASPVTTRDFVKAQVQEKLTPDHQREFLKGEMNRGASSRRYSYTKWWMHIHLSSIWPTFLSSTTR